jgi:hypothetical protein
VLIKVYTRCHVFLTGRSHFAGFRRSHLRIGSFHAISAVRNAPAGFALQLLDSCIRICNLITP